MSERGGETGVAYKSVYRRNENSLAPARRGVKPTRLDPVGDRVAIVTGDVGSRRVRILEAGTWEAPPKVGMGEIA
ncbi:MAG: hypothetical protein NVS1B4_15010 [Gemmatimonadaceae bacterium]